MTSLHEMSGKFAMSSLQSSSGRMNGSGSCSPLLSVNLRKYCLKSSDSSRSAYEDRFRNAMSFLSLSVVVRSKVLSRFMNSADLGSVAQERFSAHEGARADCLHSHLTSCGKSSIDLHTNERPPNPSRPTFHFCS